MQQQVTLVIKQHPDGYNYVPFDHDDHPSRQAIISAYVHALVNEGHVVERINGFQHRDDHHPSDFHIKLVSGPRANLGCN